MIKTSIAIIAVIFSVVFCRTSVQAAEDYKIGPGDVLQVSFWESPDHNAELRVGEDGMMTLDILGQVEAAGKTTKELQDEIAHGMSRLKRDISQCVVRVTQFNYLYVFVSGQVVAGGRMTFEQIPDLWTVINLAGGISESGDLSRVTIVRGGDQAGRVEVVNVAEAISNGTLDKLPKLRRGDTVDIPRTPGGLPSGDLSNQAGSENYVYVLGAVSTPGTINFQPNMDLLQVLAAAGGFAENADLKKVKVVSSDGAFAQTTEFNLTRFVEQGYPANYIMKRGDKFVVPYKQGGGFRSAMTTVAAVGGIATTIALIYQAVRPTNP